MLSIFLIRLNHQLYEKLKEICLFEKIEYEPIKLELISKNLMEIFNYYISSDTILY